MDPSLTQDPQIPQKYLTEISNRFDAQTGEDYRNTTLCEMMCEAHNLAAEACIPRKEWKKKELPLEDVKNAANRVQSHP